MFWSWLPLIIALAVRILLHRRIKREVARWHDRRLLDVF